MQWVLTGYSRSMGARLALLLEKCHGGLEEPWATRVYRAPDVEQFLTALRGRGGDYRVLAWGSRPLGLVYCWPPSGGRVEIGVCVESCLPGSTRRDAIGELLGYASTFCVDGDSVAEISSGFEHGALYSWLVEAIGPSIVVHRATLMKLHGRLAKIGARRVPGYSFRPACIYKDLERLVEVYNLAYSGYQWFRPLSTGAAEELFSGRMGSILYVAEDKGGRIAGFAYARVFRAVDGKKTAIITALAVHPSHRGRGVGSSLVRHVVASLPRGTRVAVIASPGLEEMYSKLGFVVRRRWVSLLLGLRGYRCTRCL